MRAIIVDDEPAGVQALTQHLRAYEQITILDSITDSRTVVSAILNYKPDVVFMDINMPHLNGIELATLLQPRNFQLVFVTAHDNFALEAYETQAEGYLLKPVHPKRLEKCITKLEGNYKKDSRPNEKRIILNDGKKQVFVAIKDIVCVESIGRYQKVSYESVEKNSPTLATLICESTMDTFDKELQAYSFYRVHRCYIINTNYISTLERNERKWFMKLNNYPSSIPVSRNKINELNKILGI